MSEINVLLVGNTDRREFRQARASLDASGRVLSAADAASGAAMLEAGQHAPDVIVVAQAYPGEFSAAEIDRLRRLAPLARVLALLGTWCEGEMRTGRPWPAVIRVYWHQWLPRWHQELGRLVHGLCPTWGLPVTATEEERLLASATDPLPKRQGRIAIHSPRFEMVDWLSAACRRRGYTTVWLQPHRPARTANAIAAIFDGTDGAGVELGQLARLAVWLPGVPILALVDFPRIEDQQRLLGGGAAAVLAKPLLVEDLFWQIDQLVGQPPTEG